MRNLPRKRRQSWLNWSGVTKQEIRDVSYANDETNYSDDQVPRPRGWGDDNREDLSDEDDNDDQGDDGDDDRGGRPGEQDPKDAGRKRDREEEDNSGGGKSSKSSPGSEPGRQTGEVDSKWR